jgi:hypothetical protein
VGPPSGASAPLEQTLDMSCRHLVSLHRAKMLLHSLYVAPIGVGKHNRAHPFSDVDSAARANISPNSEAMPLHAYGIAGLVKPNGKNYHRDAKENGLFDAAEAAMSDECGRSSQRRELRSDADDVYVAGD